MDAAQLARDVNAKTLEIAAKFEAGEDLPVDFLCECGCWAFVQRTIAEYNREDGAWCVGHKENPHQGVSGAGTRESDTGV
jgi:hypothetical protein